MSANLANQIISDNSNLTSTSTLIAAVAEATNNNNGSSIDIIDINNEINTTDYDEEQKRVEYYKSNPLKNYAPTKGQTVIPNPLNSSIFKKKQLPSAYKELRNSANDLSTMMNLNNELTTLLPPVSLTNISTNEIIDRNMYKYKLKGMLKVNLSYTDEINRKNLIDIRENTKKVYNQYCHKNLTKPVEVKNVQSSIKTQTNANSLANGINATSQIISSIETISHAQITTPAGTAEIPSNKNNNNNNATSMVNGGVNSESTKTDKVKVNLTKKANTFSNRNKISPLIHVKPARINSLEDIVDDIKQRNRYKMDIIAPPKIIYDNYNNQNIKYSYREHQQNLLNYQQKHSQQNIELIEPSQLLNADSFLNNVNYDINELELLQFASTSQANDLTGGVNNIYKRINKNPNTTIDQAVHGELDMIRHNVSAQIQQQQQQQQQQHAPVIAIHQRLRNPNSANPNNQSQKQQAEQFYSATGHISIPFETKKWLYDESSAKLSNEFILKTEEEVDLKKEISNADLININQTHKKIIPSNERVMTPNTKHRLRAQQAREKLQKQTEKSNLNKITLIQPFEDTKILINLDKVPSRVLNNLFNSNKDQVAQPNYYIPPVKAFGFFTSKSTLDNYNVANQYQTPPGTVKTTTRLTHRTSHSKHHANNNDNDEIKKQQREKREHQHRHHNNNNDNDSLSSVMSPRFSTRDFNIQSKFTKSANSNSIVA